jgi:AhpC/TSA family
MSITVGDKAPGFTLLGSGGKSYSLSDYAGKPVVLVFYPGDNTAVCTKQLCSYNNELAQFNDIGAQVLGISGPGRCKPRCIFCQARIWIPIVGRYRKRGGRGVWSGWTIGHGEAKHFCAGCPGSAPVCSQICGWTYLSPS